jgi:hypothetical protein
MGKTQGWERQESRDLHVKHVRTVRTVETVERLLSTTTYPSHRHNPHVLLLCPQERASMAALVTGRALLQACKQGILADVRACTARLLAIPNMKETNPPITMAMGNAAYTGRADTLRHLITSLPRHHWQSTDGPWDPLIELSLNAIPQEWRVTFMPGYVVYRAAAGGVPSAMQVLIDAGLDLNHVVERMGPPLGIAILHGNGKLDDFIRWLLAQGADPNDPYAFPPISLLHQAAFLRSTASMHLLLDYGTNVQESKAL